MRLMHQWWVYVDEGGSIAAEDVAFAIQYAVMYQFLKYVDHLHTRQEAREYIIYGVTAEAEYINSHKGTYPETEKESYDIALNALLEAFDQSSAYTAYDYESMTSSFSSYYSSS
ncbi:hypothetical protein NCC49_001950 [Naganishia albida]|nr:hypothetical protein NCC49_001950 [Naganishia albida]